jgi:hypothetical protein
VSHAFRWRTTAYFRRNCSRAAPCSSGEGGLFETYLRNVAEHFGLDAE